MNELDAFIRQCAEDCVNARFPEPPKKVDHYIQTIFTPEMCECGERRLEFEKRVMNTHAVVWRKCSVCYLEATDE